MERLPQSVAVRLTFDAYLTATTTPATGKVVAVQISKNGGAYANPAAGATNATEVSAGTYYVDLGTVDLGTLGPLVIKGVEGTIDTVKVHARVVDANTLGAGALPNVAAGAAGSVLRSADGSAIVTAGGMVGANVVAVNGVQVLGAGVLGDEWRPA